MAMATAAATITMTMREVDRLARPVVRGVSTKPTRNSAAAGLRFGKLLISRALVFASLRRSVTGP
jgi:hypothetical protein